MNQTVTYIVWGAVGALAGIVIGNFIYRLVQTYAR